MNFPDDLQYAETHEWMRLDSSGATVGITDYAQGELTDIVFVELPDTDRHVDAGEEIASVESVKAVGYVYAPIAGTIVACNEKLSKEPELINQDPYGEGWIARIKPDDGAETVELLTAAAYREKTESEGEETLE
jgi:glycine cleavage system H protein